MVNLLNPEKKVTIEQIGQRHAVRIPLESHEMFILKS
jgi:tRNA(Ser,Leu) C12 N-acetylase TAN1